MNSYRCSMCGEPCRNLLRICERCRFTEPSPLASDSAAEEMRRIFLWEHVPHPRLLAAAWFACAGAIPGILFLMVATRNDHPNPSAWFYILGTWLVTIALAAFYGSTFGARILDPLDVGTGAQAFWQGTVVAGFSFVTFIFLLSLYSGLQRGSLDFLSAFVLLMVFGSMLVGWAVLLVGGLAGWLLFKKYRCG